MPWNWELTGDFSNQHAELEHGAGAGIESRPEQRWNDSGVNAAWFLDVPLWDWCQTFAAISIREAPFELNWKFAWDSMLGLDRAGSQRRYGQEPQK
jgi:hypothetical protein